MGLINQILQEIKDAGIETITINEFLTLCKNNIKCYKKSNTAINKSWTTESAASKNSSVLATFNSVDWFCSRSLI
jgi:hypothetical protein